MTPTGMTEFITSLSGTVTSSSLWGEIAPVAGFVGAMILFAFGYHIIRKQVNGAPKGKAKI